MQTSQTSEENIQITEPAILLDIAERYHQGMSALELYEATRGAWRTGTKKEHARFAFAISDNLIREVYEVHSWHRAGSTPYRLKPFATFAIDGRWEFLGVLANAQMRQKYVGKSIAHYMVKRLSNDVVYLNCDVPR